jgi:hypothetical protein
MVSTVKARPNHYEMLGLAPAASDGEIARAFARQMAMFRPMADAAHIGMAYETLRDPTKRRAYDDSLGLRPEPKPVQSPTALSFRTSVRPIGSAPVGRPDPSDVETVPNPAPQAEPRPAPSAVPELGPGSFIAASLREPAKLEARDDHAILTQPKPEPRPRAEAERMVQSKIGDLLAGDRGRWDRASDEDRPAGLGRAGVAIGALVVGVALIGAWVGLDAGNAGEAQPQERAVSVPLPAPKAVGEPSATAPAPKAGLFEALPQRRAPLAVASRRVRRAPSPQQPIKVEDRLAEVSQSLQGGYYAGASVDQASEPVATEAPAVTPTKASMPLPNKVVARTLERIGYACGDVASTSAGEAPGVYNVTCTSGHSYQAKPVRGRYHFRRVDSH